nr:5'-methylthioadenosine/adenosylhomocysteine nucleosidase [uncultured Mediterraneibacter sp.]
MIGIIGAMEEEVQELIADLAFAEKKTVASMDFYKGTLYGKDCVIVKSGVGKVNAALCTQILADFYKPEALINTGVAGSLDAKINIGDMVVSKDAVQHDMDASAVGDPVGQVPRMDVLAFPADPVLVKKAVEANQKANPDIQTFTGRVASGDQFISGGEKKKQIQENFHARCAEMEGAAIAHGAYLNKIPYVILRAISDKADGSVQMDYPTFEKQAIVHCVRLLRELIPAL